ncbi:hypothetical protein CH063_03321, partial [Colletotrichum higginsianum]
RRQRDQHLLCHRRSRCHPRHEHSAHEFVHLPRLDNERIARRLCAIHLVHCIELLLQDQKLYYVSLICMVIWNGARDCTLEQGKKGVNNEEHRLKKCVLPRFSLTHVLN